MAIITIPSIRAAGANLRLIRGDTTLEFFDGSTVAVQSTKAVWALSFPLVVMRDSEARIWRAALTQLAKPANQFEITPPGYVHSLSYSATLPLVNGANQLGLALVCDGVANNATIGQIGDYIEIADTGEFKILTANAVADGVGNVTFNFEPAIRTAPATNSTIRVGISSPPKVIMRLLTPEAAWAASLPNFINMTVDAIEAF